MKSIRAITIGLGGEGEIKPKIDLLRDAIQETGNDTGVIVCIQDITSEYFRELENSGLFASVACALNVRRPARFEFGSSILQGCAFGCNEKIVLGTSSVSGHLPAKGTQSGEIGGHDENAEHVIHIHSMGSTGLNRARTVQDVSVARFLHDLADNNESAIFCGQIEEPAVKNTRNGNGELSHEEVVDREAGADFFGINPGKQIQDALRFWFKNDPVCMASLLKTPWNLPLAVTLIKGGDHQYDFVFISPQWTVTHIDHRSVGSHEYQGENPMLVCDLARAA